MMGPMLSGLQEAPATGRIGGRMPSADFDAPMDAKGTNLISAVVIAFAGGVLLHVALALVPLSVKERVPLPRTGV
jgi:hypothetical protein